MRKRTALAILGALGLGTACEEPIELDLEPSEPQLVIECAVTDSPREGTTARITYTKAFESPEPDPTVSGAMVVISDNAGNVDTLPEVLGKPGFYQLPNLYGVVGRRYFMEVRVQGETYTAEAEMRRPLVIDTLFAVWREQPLLEDGWYLGFGAQENPGLGDYVFFRFFQDDSLLVQPRFLWVDQDEFYDGQYVFGEFFNAYFTPEEAAGATVRVEAHSIERIAFEYYRSVITFQQGVGDPFSPPPWNPRSNITGGALGLFRASAVSEATTVIPE